MKKTKDSYKAVEVVRDNLLRGVLATENPYEGFRGEHWAVRDWKEQTKQGNEVLSNRPSVHPTNFKKVQNG